MRRDEISTEREVMPENEYTDPNELTNSGEIESVDTDFVMRDQLESRLVEMWRRNPLPTEENEL